MENRYRFRPGCFILVLVMPILLYFGYCWGLLGRHSLLLQYLLQCNCPTANEEARYPKSVDVVLSACSYSRTYVQISPTGRLLYIQEKNIEVTSYYLLELQTMRRVDVNDQPLSSFLTDDLWYLDSRGEKYIIDSITGVKYPIEKFVYSRPNGQINRNANQPLLLESLRQSQQIFLIGPSTDTVVALAPNFRDHPERNFVFDRFDLPKFNTEQFLQENGISYQTILPPFPGEVVSPNGMLIARGDGIYIVSTGEKIVEGFYAGGFFGSYRREYYSSRGWLYDGSGVIYSKFLNPCLIEFSLLGDAPGCSYGVPQPVILLKVPEEYLLPQDTP